MSIAERVADSFTQNLDLRHLSTVQIWILHEIKAVAVRQWAREELRLRKGD